MPMTRYLQQLHSIFFPSQAWPIKVISLFRVLNLQVNNINPASSAIGIDFVCSAAFVSAENHLVCQSSFAGLSSFNDGPDNLMTSLLCGFRQVNTALKFSRWLYCYPASLFTIKWGE